MSYCPYCKEEASAKGAGDEVISFCFECNLVIEGETLDHIGGDDE